MGTTARRSTGWAAAGAAATVEPAGWHGGRAGGGDGGGGGQVKSFTVFTGYRAPEATRGV